MTKMNFTRIFVAFLLTNLFAVPTAVAMDQRPTVLVASYEGAITPASSEWMISAIRRANQSKASALVIELDTPGGLLESTRILVREIMASPVPIILYVSPSGSRAASAGTFITMAGHIAAMAPGTRIGAAHPVEMGRETAGDMRSKIENDTVAFIKNIAASRNRNAEWAEFAVRKSSSATDQEALHLKVIDLVAKDLPNLLDEIDGRKVETASGPQILRTKNAEVKSYPLNLRVKVLRTISDPNIAYILMMIGFYGILYEIFHPGAVLPGVAGGICLILGLYAFQTLPVSTAGIALLVLALLLFIIESQVTNGLLGLGGVIALALGSLMLIPSEFPELQIHRELILGAVVTTSLFIFFVVWLLLKVKNRRAVTGIEGMIGKTAVAKTELDPKGQVACGGEIWTAESNEKILAGEEVEVISVQDLKLIVKKK